MECSQYVRLPETQQSLARSFPGADVDDLPEYPACELDSHAHGAHVAQLLYMTQDPDRALWLAWGEGIDMEVRCLPICPSASPTEDLACWLPAGHRGGHTWERYA